MFSLHDTVASPARIGLEMIGVVSGAPLDLDLRVESVSEGVLVSGTLSAPIAGECSRCLTPFTDRIQVDLTELFAYPDSLTEATTEDDEVGRVVNDFVDLNSRSSTPWAWSWPSRRCAGPTARGYARSAVLRWRPPTRPSPRRNRPALGQTLDHAAHRQRRNRQ